MFEPETRIDVLIEPLLQLHSGGMLVGGAVSLVLAVSDLKLMSMLAQTLCSGMALTPISSDASLCAL